MCRHRRQPPCSAGPRRSSRARKTAASLLRRARKRVRRRPRLRLPLRVQCAAKTLRAKIGRVFFYLPLFTYFILHISMWHFITLRSILYYSLFNNIYLSLSLSLANPLLSLFSLSFYLSHNIYKLIFLNFLYVSLLVFFFFSIFSHDSYLSDEPSLSLLCRFSVEYLCPGGDDHTKGPIGGIIL